MTQRREDDITDPSEGRVSRSMGMIVTSRRSGSRTSTTTLWGEDDVAYSLQGGWHGSGVNGGRRD